MKKQKDGTGKREERIKSGNNEIVNPKEREMPRLGKKKKKEDREQNMFRRRCDLADLRSNQGGKG